MQILVIFCFICLVILLLFLSKTTIEDNSKYLNQPCFKQDRYTCLNCSKDCEMHYRSLKVYELERKLEKENN